MRPLADDLLRGAHARHVLLGQGVDESELCGPLWTRPAHGQYAWSAVDPDDTRQRILVAASRLPGEGAVTGWAAAFLHGATRLDGLRPDAATPMLVPVCLTPDHQLRNAARAGLRVSRSRLAEDEIVTVDGVACASRVRAAFDAARFSENLTEAVVALDALLHSTVLRLQDVVGYADDRRRWHARHQVYAAAALADPWSLSCPETRLRVMWRQAGLPAPLVNPVIMDSDGRPFAMADLLDEAAALVIEYDGAHHADAGQRAGTMTAPSGCTPWACTSSGSIRSTSGRSVGGARSRGCDGCVTAAPPRSWTSRGCGRFRHDATTTCQPWRYASRSLLSDAAWADTLACRAKLHH
jgi:hypothetical protein